MYEFAARHFSRAHSSHKDKLLRPLVICGPSGVGKGTLLNLLFKEFGSDFGFSVSHVRRRLCWFWGLLVGGSMLHIGDWEPEWMMG